MEIEDVPLVQTGFIFWKSLKDGWKCVEGSMWRQKRGKESEGTQTSAFQSSYIIF